MSRYEHGRVLAVNETTLGSELVGDHAAGVSSLTVEDPVDFDEDGGWLSINGQVAEYSTYDDDTGEITLVGTLDAAAGEGDRVDLWDELRQVVTVDKIAQVELDGDDDNTDPLEAVIPLHLLDDLEEGIRGLRGESVLLEQDGDEWRIVDVLGLPTGASGVQFWDKDTYTLTAAGAQEFLLTHEPIDGSLHVIWNGLDQPRSEFTVSGNTVTVPDPSGFIEVGDVIDFKYAYRRGNVTTVFDNVEYASGADNPLTVPLAAADGDLLIAFVTLPTDVSASNLNGYAFVGETASVTHDAGGSPHTYRLAIYARTKPQGAAPVPEFNASTNDTPWVLAAFRGATGVATSRFDTLADGSRAATRGPADIRVWATIGWLQQTTPDSGTVVAGVNENQIDITATVDANSGDVYASVPDTAGWLLASLTVGR